MPFPLLQPGKQNVQPSSTTILLESFPVVLHAVTYQETCLYYRDLVVVVQCPCLLPAQYLKKIKTEYMPHEATLAHMELTPVLGISHGASKAESFSLI